ncbi:VWA domain-containing protein [Streptomyces herbicida]|uniref:VWA domain-containing protein n=1 Tax=Streptomyces herbicida TaxID=3065675 RepID=UPI0029319F6E|nr:VWA domain-containing protein [Streptomyces sp. NEAU-HV9]
MGILTLLRNAFGRSRKTRTAEAEGADRVPSQEQEPQVTPSTPHVPEPRTSASDEHDLVSAAFDNITVPKQADPTEAPLEPTAEPVAEAEPELEPVAEVEPEPVVEVEAEPEPEAAVEPEAEPVAEVEPEPEPVAEVEAEPEPEAAGEPVAEVEPDVEPEPVVAAEPEPEAAVEPEPTAETTPEPIAEAEPVVEPEPVAEVEPVVEPEPEPVAEVSEPEPVAGAASAPAAADGEDAPQGPPAPEDETRTGGAGGNEPAEGEAEAVAGAASAPAAAGGEDAPQGPPAPEDETRTGGAGGNEPAEGEAEAAAPAITLARLKSRAPGLATAYKAATATLKKTNLTGTRAKLYLVLDRSASMRPYYKDGSAQAIAEQTLALAAHLDPEATVHVVFFSTEVDGTTDLTLATHENKIDEVHAGLGRMGRTSYHAAVEAVLAHHKKEHDAAAPALVVFQTDGAPDAKTPATQSLTDAAKNHPSVFFSFVAFGEHDNKAFDYLRKLKTENTSFFHAGPTPRELTDTELYEGVLANWRP